VLEQEGVSKFSASWHDVLDTLKVQLEGGT
jgi:hypothetical protein